jgi:hypothetical protein
MLVGASACGLFHTRAVSLERRQLRVRAHGYISDDDGRSPLRRDYSMQLRTDLPLSRVCLHQEFNLVQRKRRRC